MLGLGQQRLQRVQDRQLCNATLCLLQDKCAQPAVSLLAKRTSGHSQPCITGLACMQLVWTSCSACSVYTRPACTSCRRRRHSATHRRRSSRMVGWKVALTRNSCSCRVALQPHSMPLVIRAYRQGALRKLGRRGQQLEPAVCPQAEGKRVALAWQETSSECCSLDLQHLNHLQLSQTLAGLALRQFQGCSGPNAQACRRYVWSFRATPLHHTGDTSDPSHPHPTQPHTIQAVQCLSSLAGPTCQPP